MAPRLNQLPPNEPRELWKHFSDTYFSLRLGLALLAFAMPFVLYFYGRFMHGLALQPSMSRYFWAATASQCAAFPMRTIFVGFLLAISVGLYLYKGLTKLENYLLNAAGICAALVAVYPERISLEELAVDPALQKLVETCPAILSWASQDRMPIHYLAASILFLLLAAVSWFCAYKSLIYVPSKNDPLKYQRTYKKIAIAMLGFPAFGFIMALFFNQRTQWVFFVEAAGVITFGIYWLVKTKELALSRLENDPIIAVEKLDEKIKNT